MKYRTFQLAMLLAASCIFSSCSNYGSNTNTANANANVANANTATSSAASEADVRKLVDDAMTALNKNDAAALDKIYSDDYVLTNIDGSTQTRGERLESIRSGETKYDSFGYEDIKVRMYGDTAVVAAVATIKGKNKGQVVDGKFQVTQVYVKTKDGWKQVAAQATKIVAAGKPVTPSTAANANKPMANSAATNKPAANKPAANAPANKGTANTTGNTNK